MLSIVHLFVFTSWIEGYPVVYSSGPQPFQIHKLAVAAAEERMVSCMHTQLEQMKYQMLAHCLCGPVARGP